MIEEMEKMVRELPEVPGMIDMLKRESNGVTEYSVDGDMLSWSVMNQKDIAIAHTYFSKESIIGLHLHKSSYEIIIVLDGEIDIEFEDGKSVKLEKHGWLHIEKNKPHLAIVHEPTWIIAITVPKDDGFPK